MCAGHLSQCARLPFSSSLAVLGITGSSVWAAAGKHTLVVQLLHAGLNLHSAKTCMVRVLLLSLTTYAAAAAVHCAAG